LEVGNVEATGQGLVDIPSDKAEVRATVERRILLANRTDTKANETEPGGAAELEFEGGDLRALSLRVQQAVSSSATAVVDFLTSANSPYASRISKVRTTAVTLEPLYRYHEGKQTLFGYKAENEITFEVDLEVAGEVIDEIVNRGKKGEKRGGARG
jgi:uncharacterized protein YggE